MQRRFAQLLSIAVLITVWWSASRIIGTNLLPPPEEVADTLLPLVSSGEFLEPTLTSLSRAVLAFGISLVVGTAFGTVAGRVRLLRRMTALPLNIALFAPALVVIFVGVAVLDRGILSIALIAAVLSTPSIATFVKEVMSDFDDEILEMATSYRIGSWRRFRDLYLPYLTPTLLTAGRIGFNSCWKIVLLTEVFGFPGGLGFKIRISFTSYNLVVLVAWLTIFVGTLLLIEQVIQATEKRFVRWV